MAFYDFDHSGHQLGGTLGRGLDGLRAAMTDLPRVLASFNQMTDQQVADSIGMQADGGTTAVQKATAFKAELASDVAQLLSVQAALNQLLAQTG